MRLLEYLCACKLPLSTPIQAATNQRPAHTTHTHGGAKVSAANKVRNFNNHPPTYVTVTWLSLPPQHSTAQLGSFPVILGSAISAADANAFAAEDIINIIIII